MDMSKKRSIPMGPAPHADTPSVIHPFLVENAKEPRTLLRDPSNTDTKKG
jgi:hypothetical protein